MKGIRNLGALLGFVVLAVVLYTLDAAQIGQSLTSIPPAYAVAGLFLVQFQIGLSAWRWQFTAQRLGMALPARHAVRDYYLSSFLNQVLP
ncbi:MAG: lysylphosphatidylglycerol synthase domain-containing protein, partial [Pseudorhizobium sp.]